MRIAFFLGILGDGGTERSTIRLAKELVARGYRVDLVASSVRGDMVREVSAGVRLVDLKAGGTARAIIPYIHYLRREDPEIVFACPSSVCFVAAAVNGTLTRRRTVIFVQHTWEGVLHGRQARFRYGLQQKFVLPAYRRAEAIIAVSHASKQQLLGIAGMRPERIHVIYGPIWSPALEESAREAVTHPWLAEPRGGPVILAVGRLSREKGIDTLLRAFALLPRGREARLLVLGEGEERPALEQLVAELGLTGRVSMPGFEPNPFAYMARSALLVLPSRHEALGNVLVEAMAVGTPVVSTNSPGGTGEILEQGRFGTQVPVDDPPAMARAIEATLDAPLAPELLRARARVFSATSSVVAVEQLMHELAARRRP
ncbi:glycosyltransferase [Ancylobacter vacuolatus]|uniref:Glycosyltransferase involved in cell wall biosynthesis n=1 Tax=Ancylobacter vacuolatus TaxID=223389 RepID=A0ABU0DL86_9HYPH|nr:glycosyltransferase [Ancylobacter vacuolatus]MDQ0349000.1 glycosyltransferase involved in cell wall biosynthesis [Ancylobacter vacuolatus]